MYVFMIYIKKIIIIKKTGKEKVGNEKVLVA